MTMTSRVLLFAALFGTLSPALAQDHDRVFVSNDDAPGPHRTFALVSGTAEQVHGSWQGGDGLSVYTHAHPGHYVVFVEGGELHRLDNPAVLAEIEQAYAPMLPLEARQRELAAQQKPLSAQQHTLGLQQHEAAGNPVEQARVGAEQARVGRQQGEIGRVQGEIGRQQGEMGRAFYARVQTLLSACLANGSCPRVTS